MPQIDQICYIMKIKKTGCGEKAYDSPDIASVPVSDIVHNIHLDARKSGTQRYILEHACKMMGSIDLLYGAGRLRHAAHLFHACLGDGGGSNLTHLEDPASTVAGSSCVRPDGLSFPVRHAMNCSNASVTACSIP